MASKTAAGRKAAEPPAPVSGMRDAALLAVGVAGLVCTVWLVSISLADDGNAGARDAARRRVAALSQADRDRLVENYRKFQTMPAGEQETLRQLHRDLERDARDGGTLRDLLDLYAAWVQTLPDNQRVTLREETDPARRERMVARLLVEQPGRPVPPTGDNGDDRPYPPRQPGEGPDREDYPDGPQRHGLSREDLLALIDALEPVVRDTLSEPQRKELLRMKGMQRVTFVLRLALEEDRQSETPLFTPELLANMIDRIGNPAQRDALRLLAPHDQRRVLLQLVVSGIRSEFERHKPNEEMLERFAAKLPESERRGLDGLPFEERRQRLIRLFVAANPDAFHPQTGEFLRFLERSLGRGERFPGPGPFDGPGEDRQEGKFLPRGERPPVKFPAPRPNGRRPDDKRRPGEDGEFRPGPGGERGPDGDRRPPGPPNEHREPEKRPPPDKRPVEAGPRKFEPRQPE